MPEREVWRVIHWTPRAWWIVTERFVDGVSHGYTPHYGPYQTAQQAHARYALELGYAIGYRAQPRDAT